MSGYLGIEAKETVARNLDEHFFSSGFQIDLFRSEVWSFLGRLELDKAEALDARMTERISSDETFRFFRGKERLNNTKLIIQYLMRFCDGLPDESAIMNDLVNPFDQMREFTAYHLNQMNEEDVIDAILREHRQLGLLKESNQWYYQGQIRKNYLEFSSILERAILPNREGYLALFTTLRNISKFWFSVRREDSVRCRRTDVFIYLFCTHLLKNLS